MYGDKIEIRKPTKRKAIAPLLKTNSLYLFRNSSCIAKKSLYSQAAMNMKDNDKTLTITKNGEDDETSSEDSMPIPPMAARCTPKRRAPSNRNTLQSIYLLFASLSRDFISIHIPLCVILAIS